MPCIVDSSVSEERSRCYLGIARVSLAALNFSHTLVQDKHRAVSPSNVARLVKIFERNGCLRSQEENVVHAVIRDEVLASALLEHNLTHEEFRDLHWAQDAPLLNISEVQCLSGLHRIEAAREYLDDNDKWWTVRLFSYNTSKSTLTRIVEAYAYEQRPSDGEIFRKIRFYHRQKDEESEKRWWSCLEKSKPKDLRQLLRRKQLVSAFDTLIDMPGLWKPVQIGALHRLLALKCDEEMVLHLQHIAKSWHRILRCETQTLPSSAVDAVTVQSLEFLAPGDSLTDKDLVEDLMARGILFPLQSNNSVRQSLLRNLCAFSGLIPSLRTFFDMLKYLEPACEILRKLLDNRLKSTIRSSLSGLFFAPSKTYVQASENKQSEILSSISIDDKFIIAYADVWAFCNRHFDGLTASTPLKDPNEPKPMTKGPNPVAWNHLAHFVLSRGFRIPNAQAIIDQGESCYRKLALEYLCKAHPNHTQFTQDQVQSIIKSSQIHAGNGPEGAALQDFDFLPPNRRGSRPFEVDYIREKQILFLPNLYNRSTYTEATLSFARWDLFACLFRLRDLHHYEFGTPIRNNLVSAEAMDIDTEDNFPYVANPQLLAEIQALKETQRVIESQHNHLLERIRASHKEEMCSVRKELGLNKAIQTELEADNHGLREALDLGKVRQAEIEASNSDLLKTSRDLYKQLQARKQLEAQADQMLIASQPLRVNLIMQQEPEAIEAATVPIMEDESFLSESDSLDDELNVRCDSSSREQDQFELFIGFRNDDDDGCLIGRSFTIPKDVEEAIPSIARVLSVAKAQFSGQHLSAVTLLGKRVPSLEPSYIFGMFSQHHETVCVAPEAAVARFVASMTVSVIQQASEVLPSVITVTKAAISSGKRRRAEDEHGVTTKESTTDEEVRVFTAGEDPDGNKRRLLKLKGLAGTRAPLLLTYDSPQDSSPGPVALTHNTIEGLQATNQVASK